MDNDTVKLLHDISVWLDSYIVDTPEKRTYKGAEELSKRVSDAAPARQGANRKPDTFSTGDK